MKTYFKNILKIIGSTVFIIVGMSIPTSAFASVAPTLGGLSTHAVVSSTFTNSNTAPQTILKGDVCATTQPTTVPLTVTGTTTTPCDPTRGTEQTDVLSNGVYGLNTQACTAVTSPLNAYDIDGAGPIAPGTFTPGCYVVTGAMNIVLSTSITLDAGGDSNAVFIFRSTGALNTGNNSSVLLTGNANSDKVFWAPAGLATIGAYTTGGIPPVAATFVGTIVDAAGITFGHFAYLLGHAIAYGGTVTTDANTIEAVAPFTLTVIKHVISSYGGTAVAGNFILSVKKNNVNVFSSPQVGSESGTAYLISPGTYVVSESTNSLYTSSFSGSCDNTGTVVFGSNTSCTITNTEIAPVVHNYGHPPIETTSTVTYVAPTVSTVTTPNAPIISIHKFATPTHVSYGPTSVVYTYTVSNIGTVALSDIGVVDDKCSALSYTGGDSNVNKKLEQTETWTYTCTSVISQTTKNTATATGFSDDSYHTMTQASAWTTVTVGVTPKLPNTGFPPEEKGSMTRALIALVVISGVTYLIVRNRKIFSK